MCTLLLSLFIVGGVEIAPEVYMIEYLEGGRISRVLIPTEDAARCFERP